MPAWPIYDPNAKPRSRRVKLPPPPPWRQPGPLRSQIIAATFRPNAELVDAVNTALFLRRPLLITGKPGTGKSSLVFAVAEWLKLGAVMEWPIHSRSTLQDGLYLYDAMARLQQIQQNQGRADAANTAARTGVVSRGYEAAELGTFLRLGPLGAALASRYSPRALLIDEIDKSDIDLPSDLLNVLDSGKFEIPELQRVATLHPVVRILSGEGESITIERGRVTFTEYPFIVMTSNGERDFPSPFLRRCVQCQVSEPNKAELTTIVRAHFPGLKGRGDGLIDKFLTERDNVTLATDQLLNAVHLLLGDVAQTFSEVDEARLLQTLLKGLG